eukprot:3512286-Prymnesium_polylepis.1
MLTLGGVVPARERWIRSDATSRRSPGTVRDELDLEHKHAKGGRFHGSAPFSCTAGTPALARRVARRQQRLPGRCVSFLTSLTCDGTSKLKSSN